MYNNVPIKVWEDKYGHGRVNAILQPGEHKVSGQSTVTFHMLDEWLKSDIAGRVHEPGGIKLKQFDYQYADITPEDASGNAASMVCFICIANGLKLFLDVQDWTFGGDVSPKIAAVRGKLLDISRGIRQ